MGPKETGMTDVGPKVTGMTEMTGMTEPGALQEITEAQGAPQALLGLTMGPTYLSKEEGAPHPLEAPRRSACPKPWRKCWSSRL